MGVVLTDVDYERFKRSLKDTIGLDLNHYKQQQMQRRIRQWLERTGAAAYQDYLQVLKSDARERARFTEYLTINTSQFYRDVAVFRQLEEEVLPELVKGHRRLRIWSAGASIGAEIYSIAMILAELTPGLTHSLLATDFDQSALAKAKEAVYGENLLKTLPERYKSRYFRVEKGFYRLDAGIVSMVKFQRHNLLEDAYGTGFHMILCRNVFIYFTPETQAQLTVKFSDSLVPGGMFVVGSAENLMTPETADLKRVAYCIYQRQ